jgi:hypothetical protein
MGNNNVNIRIDSRIFYGLVAVAAIAGIFAVGIWLGGYLGDGGTPSTASTGEPVVEGVAPVPGGANPADPGVIVQATPMTQPEIQTGSVPKSVEEVPVGDGEPRLWIPEAAEANWEYSLGSISPNDKTEKDFVVQNVGTAVLEISDASASCGCTAAMIADTSLEPGEETVIRVTYDPRVNQEAGRFVTKQIRVKSNDPLVPLAEFTITADVAAQ